MKQVRIVAIMHNPSMMFCGIGSGTSAIMGARIVQNRAHILQKPKEVVAKVTGNKSKVVNQSVNNAPRIPNDMRRMHVGTTLSA